MLLSFLVHILYALQGQSFDLMPLQVGGLCGLLQLKASKIAVTN